MGVSWVKKYVPLKSSEVPQQKIKELKEFVLAFPKSKKKAAIVYGPSGCGKTISAHIIAEELGLEIVEINASDFRNAEEIEAKVGAAAAQMSLFAKGKLILVDEVDGIAGRKDRGGVPAIAKIIAKTSFPIVMTASNPWDKKFTPLRGKSLMLQFEPVNYLSIYSILENVCSKENLSFEEPALKSVARRCGGDIRAAINDLQTISSGVNNITAELVESLSERNKVENMITALVKVFKISDPAVAITAFDNVEDDLDKSILWLDENLHKEYSGKDLARAYDMLSMADVFRGRIRRQQHWRFLVYVNTLISAGVAVSKDEKNPRFVKYAPTSRILKLWRANMKYQKRKAIAGKIASGIHCCQKEAVKSALPFVSFMFKKSADFAENFAKDFDLDDAEIEWLKNK